MVNFIFQNSLNKQTNKKYLKNVSHPHALLEPCHIPIRRRTLCIFPLNLGGPLWISQLTELAGVMLHDLWGQVHLALSFGCLLLEPSHHAVRKLSHGETHMKRNWVGGWRPPPGLVIHYEVYWTQRMVIVMAKLDYSERTQCKSKQMEELDGGKSRGNKGQASKASSQKSLTGQA